MTSCMFSVSIYANTRTQLTDTRDHDDVAILPLPHDRQDSLDDVDIREEVDLKNLIHQTFGAITLSQFLDGANYS